MICIAIIFECSEAGVLPVPAVSMNVLAATDFKPQDKDGLGFIFFVG